MTDHTDLLRRLQEASGKAFGSWPWELCLQAKVAIEALEADNAALREDAERYRFLRNDECDTIGVEADKGTGNWEFIAGNDLDAAIDAMREGKGTK